jgi:prephenate dehydrogenase
VAATGAVPRLIPADVHDKAVAITSHAPQVVASLLAARLVDAGQDEVSVAGQGLRDVVRIAQSEPDLWADILTANAAEVVPVLDSLAVDLDTVRSGLGSGGSAAVDAVRDLLMAGNLGSALLPAKHGGAPARYSELHVEVDDTPGALGRLFLAAGDAGINLEDVRIEHTLGRLTAIAHLSVEPASEGPLRAVLSEGGWRILR